jgi:anti-anti-sigma factor
MAGGDALAAAVLPRGSAPEGYKMPAISTSLPSPVQIHCVSDIAIVKLIGDVGELAIIDLAETIQQCLARFDEMPGVRNVVIDLERSDYCGSSALGLFVSLARRCQSRGGRLLFCLISEHMREVLQVTGLDGCWPLCRTLDEALGVIQSASPGAIVVPAGG